MANDRENIPTSDANAATETSVSVESLKSSLNSSHVDTLDQPEDKPKEIGGRGGLDPVRFGDWEKNGRCIDF